MKPAAGVAVCCAMPAPLAPAFLAPPPSYLPAAPLSPAVARPFQLTADRLVIYNVMLVVLFAITLLGAIASFADGYLLVTNSGHELVSARPAGSGGSAFWMGSVACLAVLGLVRPSRRVARIVGWSLVAMLFIGGFVALASADLFNLDGLSWSKHIEETGAVAMLELAVGTAVLSGPVMLIAQWLLFRAERRAVR